MSRTYDCSDPADREAGIAAAVTTIHRGGLVVVPTDTVYGIAADAFSAPAVDGLLVVATAVAGNTANIPQLEATAPVLGLIVTEAVVQDGYMNALTDGFGGA